MTRSEEAAVAAAEAYSLHRMVQRFRNDYDVDDATCDYLARELKRYLALAGTAEPQVSYPMMGPPDGLDGLWHAFILHTKDYAEFCDLVAGRFIHHEPVDPDDASGEEFGSDPGYAEFLARYEDCFGEAAPADLWPRPVTEADRRSLANKLDALGLTDTERAALNAFFPASDP